MLEAARRTSFKAATDPVEARAGRTVLEVLAREAREAATSRAIFCKVPSPPRKLRV